MTKRKRKNWLKRVMIIIVLAALVVGGFFVMKNWPKEEAVDSKDKIEQQAEKIEEKKAEKEEDKAEDTAEIEVEKKKVEQFEGENPNEKTELTGVMTYAGVNDGKLMVRVNIDQYLSGGECELSLYRDGERIYTETAEVIDSAATATCKGFNVATAELGGGKINIKILVTSGEKTGIIEGEVNL